MGLLTGYTATISNAAMLTVAERPLHETRVTHHEVQRFLLVTKLVSTVNLTMLTRMWLLRLPSLTQIFLNYGISG